MTVGREWGFESTTAWHPSYGEFVKHRERNDDSEIVLPESRLKLIPPCSTDELGRAVKAYFAEPGSPDADAGWPLWEKDYERRSGHPTHLHSLRLR